MTLSVQPDTLAGVVIDLQKRIQKLESYPPAAMTEIVSVPNGSTAALPFASGATDIPATRSAAFKFVRPTSILVIPTLVYYTSGGTANYGYAWCLIENGSNVPVASSSTFIHTNGTVVTDSCHPFRVLLPAGTYTAVMAYSLDSGATTTWTAAQYQIDVLGLGG